MSEEQVKEAETESPCPCTEPCKHEEQLRSALVQYLEHDVFQAHPLASSGGVAALVGVGFWALRAWRKRK